ncbi:hypothetical protein [Clostridium thermarum]|uniref:hypothetical protein n=1 Tax=Clostridium thermarum TaxID=1716543 RepID=UPI00112330E3|nr:hypothetical protein [Clostridium thermarum]
MEYYYIQDINKVGKINNFVPYLYDVEKGWVVDNNNILMDRIMGYDGELIGNSSELFNIEEISEEEADLKIKKLYNK